MIEFRLLLLYVADSRVRGSWSRRERTRYDTWYARRKPLHHRYQVPCTIAPECPTVLEYPATRHQTTLTPIATNVLAPEYADHLSGSFNRAIGYGILTAVPACRHTDHLRYFVVDRGQNRYTWYPVSGTVYITAVVIPTTARHLIGQRRPRPDDVPTPATTRRWPHFRRVNPILVSRPPKGTRLLLLYPASRKWPGCSTTTAHHARMHPPS